MSWRISGIVALGVVLGIVLGRLAQDPDTGTASWDGLRAAGFRLLPLPLVRAL